MQRKQLLLFLLIIIAFVGYATEPSDSIVSHRSLFIIPQAAYQQETSLASGIACGYYFKSNDISRISSISSSAIYTFRNQFLFNFTPKIYFNKNKWFIYFNLNLRNYPDYYFGIGNKPSTTKQKFTSQNFSILLQPQYIVSKHLFLGTLLSARFEQIYTDSTFETTKADIFQQYGSAGWEPFSQTSVGVMAAYDSRDNQFYPQKGIFTKTTVAVAKAGWGSSYSTQELTLDYRQYLPLFGSHTLTWQAYFDGIWGKKNIPFQLLPTIGGRDLMRGFRQGMYRENVLLLAQTEYRLPIYKRLKASVFLSVGDVMNSSDCVIDKLKVAYGAGFRYRLNDARVHLRLDFAKNNYGDKLQFYITATEAF